MAPSPASEEITDSTTTASSSPPPPPPIPTSNGGDSSAATIGTTTTANVAPASEKRANFATKNASSAFGQQIVPLSGPKASITAIERRRLSSRPGFSERRRTSILVGQRSLDIMSELPTSDEAKAPRFVAFIIRYYRKWGYFIADHDWQAIVICFIISAFALVKVVTTPQQNDITGYSPYGARAREEHKRYQEFFSHDGLGLAVYNGFEIQTDLAEKGQPLTGRMDLKYPISSMFGRQLSLQNNFFGIGLNNNTGYPDIPENTTLSTKELKKRVTNMKYVKMVVLQFRAEHDIGWEDADIKAYEMKIVNYFKNDYKSKNLEIFVLSTTYVEEEMVRAGISLVPYLSVGFLIMCACAVISVVVRALYLHQHSIPKILLALAACIVPFMSCATALAMMFLCGMRFASILCVIPFLVLAIGVDSSYLMIHEWQRVIQQCREKPNRRNSQIGYRIAEVLSEVGPAIMISALTNILADAVGAFTSSPEITLLCVGNLTSMAVAFIFQMTFYTGLMSLIGRYEIKVERKERNKREASLRDKKASIANHNQLTRQTSKFHEETKEAISKTMWGYVSFIANKFVAGTIIFLYFAYIAFSIYGITQININLSTQKLFTADSPLLELDKLRVEYQVPHFTMATVFVNMPGNFSNPARLRLMNQFVEDMESLEGSWGPIGSKYFIRDFLLFQNSFEDSDFEEEDIEPPEEPLGEDTQALSLNATLPTPNEASLKKLDHLIGLYKDEDLPSFIAWPEYSFWGGFIRLTNDTRLEKFFFTTAYHGKDLSIWTERGKLLNKWRDTVDKYTGYFDASVYHEDGIFLDLIENMPSDTWQSVAGALVCMGFVCYIFLNSWFAVTIATVAVLSICTGILGLISWWHVDLDPISMAAMIICVGSSCDLPAHTSFHYYLATVREGHRSDPKVKLASCLSTIAFPAIQAAISMILCVCSLLFVHIYMSTVFVKTMVLCVILCNLHALVFIPAFLVMFDYVRFGFNLGKVSPKEDENVIEEADTTSPKFSIGASRSLPVPPFPNRSRTPSPSAPTPSKVVDRPEVKLDTPTENMTEIPLSKV
uniref:SSD domain-containing protein n=1 Tax=Panagrolaimus superbus TaxID=310955 RepID=A0A914Z6M2_9BILA